MYLQRFLWLSSMVLMVILNEAACRSILKDAGMSSAELFEIMNENESKIPPTTTKTTNTQSEISESLRQPIEKIDQLVHQLTLLVDKLEKAYESELNAVKHMNKRVFESFGKRDMTWFDFGKRGFEPLGRRKRK